MCNSDSLDVKIKIGILKELHKRGLLNRDELDRAIKIIVQRAEGDNPA